MSALENIGKSLNEALRRLLRLPFVDEKAVKELVKDIQRALLQADVNVNLVLQVSKKIEDRAINEALPPGISRREHVIKILYEELVKLLGGEPAKITVQPGKTNVIMLVGIQGSGKTLTTVKLARFYQKKGMKTGIICADTFRPGAFEQLKQLADKVGIPVYGEEDQKKPSEIALNGLTKFRKETFDVVIIDTAGRHKNEKDLMEEMKNLAEAIKPEEIILTVDGTIGQLAMEQAKAFNEATPIGSIIVTKLDGSARGGGALSAVAATGAKIKFIGSGEKIDDIEQFVPTNFVGRLLGMGDIKGLLEKVREAETRVPEEKVRAFFEGRFTLKDMYDQMEALRRLGPLKKIWRMLPGSYSIPEDAIETAEEKLDAWRAIIQSMRKDEIENPRIIDSSRARRIARGSGKSEKEVRELVNQYFMLRKMMKTLKRRQAVMRRLPLPI
jgi:signal recognition particle subunit SRP54